jgi:predicted dehydrogenase
MGGRLIKRVPRPDVGVTMGRTFNVAFVGCGQVARVHLAALVAVPSARLVALCDRDRDQARALAQLAPHATLHRDLDEALSVHRIDAVHVLTPPEAHAAIAIRAAEAGCHVLVEKPMALDRADAARMIEAAMRSGVTLVPNHNYSFKPSIERARALVLSGEVGEVVAVNGFYGISGERSSYGADAGRLHWAWMCSPISCPTSPICSWPFSEALARSSAPRSAVPPTGPPSSSSSSPVVERSE